MPEAVVAPCETSHQKLHDFVARRQCLATVRASRAVEASLRQHLEIQGLPPTAPRSQGAYLQVASNGTERECALQIHWNAAPPAPSRSSLVPRAPAVAVRNAMAQGGGRARPLLSAGPVLAARQARAQERSAQLQPERHVLGAVGRSWRRSALRDFASRPVERLPHRAPQIVAHIATLQASA